MSWITENLGNIFGAAGQVGSIYGALDSADSVEGMGNEMYTYLNGLGESANSGSQFQGYGVTSQLGNTTIGGDGSVNLGVGPDGAMQHMAGSNSAAAGSNFNYGASLAGQNSSNPYAQQSAGGLGTAMGMALGSQGNPAYSNAMSLLGGNASNPAYSQASGMIGRGSQNGAYDQAMNSQASALSGLAGHRDVATDAANSAISNSMSDTAGREQAIFDRAMAMQNPALDRAQAAQQSREHAMGRGGVRGSQFGGTAEDAAMARARAEAANNASFAAMDQGQKEMMNQASLANQYGQLGQNASGMLSKIGETMGSLGRDNAQLSQQAGQFLGNMGRDNAQLGQQAGQYMGNLGYQQGQLGQNAAQVYGQMANNLGALGNSNAQTGQSAAQIMAQIAQGQGGLGESLYGQSYLPMEQQMQLLQLAGADADRAQTGQLSGLGYLTQMGLGGAEINVNSQNVANQLRASLYDSILDNMGGNSSTEGGSSGIMGLLESILNKGG